ncbi:UNKNOWN [Stylonychia lemnae]|uniref:CRC domain-containing protein n=1 Tax=Stylonychia lemnae TaxID=5949 RepID=A0A078BBC7_STYLE|nr:UNKNOWN [Stylonychia lemnae]|eukprot:CDW91860.1 UNKNOWN [Stylonychia lemnae]
MQSRICNCTKQNCRHGNCGCLKAQRSCSDQCTCNPGCSNQSRPDQLSCDCHVDSSEILDVNGDTQHACFLEKYESRCVCVLEGRACTINCRCVTYNQGHVYLTENSNQM